MKSITKSKKMGSRCGYSPEKQYDKRITRSISKQNIIENRHTSNSVEKKAIKNGSSAINFHSFEGSVNKRITRSKTKILLISAEMQSKKEETKSHNRRFFDESNNDVNCTQICLLNSQKIASSTTNIQTLECPIDKRLTRSNAKNMSISAQIPSKNETTQSQNPRVYNKPKSNISYKNANSKQICLVKIYRVGDIIFVHLKGFNNWPAKIINIIEGKRRRYSVVFFEYKSRMATVFHSQITDFVSGLRSESIKSQIRKNAELHRYTKEAMVHVFGRMIPIE